MEAIGKPYKFGAWQIQKIIDNYLVEKIQVKLFNRTKNGSLHFGRFQALYVLPKDWKQFKAEMKKAKK